MKPAPQGWPRISSGLYYRDAAAMIDWLCRAFGFEVRLRVAGEDGRVAHSELTYGDGVVMLGEERRGETQRFGHDAASPLSVDGANTQQLMIYVDDVEAHCARARAAGARIVDE
ncbi:MAG TPA: VOC family protein, partial [Steroidobacteraceae bacterium]|nr:VOC family protein [Steroidobacteraceae bacterium]